MDGTAEPEEEEIRPTRGKSIRLPEDTDLEAQRSHPLSPPRPNPFPATDSENGRSALFSATGTRKTVRFSESNTYQPPPSRSPKGSAPT